MENIKEECNKPKIKDGSYKILIQKLEISLDLILKEIDKENTKMINFNQLGRMFTILGIFRILQYNGNMKCFSLKKNLI